MPSPIAHSLMGYTISRLTPGAASKRRISLTLFYLLTANAPDLDFIPGFLIGEPGYYHQGISHSFGFAVLWASVFSIGIALLRWDAPRRVSAILFFLYSSHVVLDYFGADTGFPFGVPLLWPLTDDYYLASYPFFSGIRRASGSSMNVIFSLVSFHNLFAITIEFFLLAPVVWFVLVLQRRRKVAE